MKKLPRKPILQPLGDRVVVSPPPEKNDKGGEQKVGGIIIPEVGQTGRVLEPYYVAEVLAVGPDCKRVERTDTVIVARPDLFHVEAGGHDVMMVREPMVVAVIR